MNMLLSKVLHSMKICITDNINVMILTITKREQDLLSQALIGMIKEVVKARDILSQVGATVDDPVMEINRLHHKIISVKEE